MSDAACCQSQYADRHDLGAVQRNQAMRRTHELHRSHAVSQLIAHHFGDGQFCDRFVQCGLQSNRQRNARDGLVEENVFGVALGFSLELAGRGAFLLQTLGERRRGLAIRAVGDFGRHELFRFGPVGALGQYVRDERCQPARRGKDADYFRISGCQLRFGEARCNAVAERCAEPLERFGRQFFREEFDQQIGAHAASRWSRTVLSAARSMSSACSVPGLHMGKPARTRESRYACDTLRARLRIRPI